MANNKQTQAQKTQAKLRAQQQVAAASAAEAAAKRNKKLAIILVSGGVALAILIGIIIGIASCAGKTADIVDGRQKVTTNATASGSSNITVKAGMPVDWTIDCTKLSRDNPLPATITSSDLGITKTLTAGSTVTVTFTPKRTGTFTVLWPDPSCVDPSCSTNVALCKIIVT